MAALHVVGWTAGPPGVEGLSDTYGVLRTKIIKNRPAVKKKMPHCGIFLARRETPQDGAQKNLLGLLTAGQFFSGSI
jgi:hypothetical protein